ncbi:MAG: hypothetical protein LDLANPLL_02797 [Turneriella sp.]|nr:hypothetical protein [Turneriella sp.]
MQKRAEIVYVFDGYCGWCWGISDTIVRLKNDFQDKFIFSAHPGGLMTGERIGPIGDFGAYIEKAMPRVTEMTGAIFSEAHKKLIQNRSTIMDSTIPAAAFQYIVDKNKDTDTVDLSHEILSLNFEKGFDLRLPESYTSLFSKYGVDASTFKEALQSKEFLHLVEEDFERARTLFGAESFPTLVYGNNADYYPLCQGYKPYDVLAEAFNTLYENPPNLSDK